MLDCLQRKGMAALARPRPRWCVCACTQGGSSTCQAHIGVHARRLACAVRFPCGRCGAGAPHDNTNAVQAGAATDTNTATPGPAPASRAARPKTHTSLLIITLRAPRLPARSTGSAHHASKHQTGFPTLNLNTRGRLEEGMCCAQRRTRKKC